MIIEPFPGDEGKVLEPNWKPAIFAVPPFVVIGMCWFAGIRNIRHLIVLTLFLSGVISGLLYYLFFAESDYLVGSLRNLFRRR